jgi:3-deoxy-D-manno-octulosonate 8-phosphate phosphatase KdsC-like HAD superfamily phosphatase
MFLAIDQLDAGLQFAVRRGLARAAAALADPGDDHLEAAVLDRVLLDVAAAQADEAVARQRLVVVVADPAGGQLVGRDVVDQLARRVVGKRSWP